MNATANAIVKTLRSYGPANSLQLADLLGNYGIAPALRYLESEGVIYWDEAEQAFFLLEWNFFSVDTRDPEMEEAADSDEDSDEGYEYNDSMDGDHESALASVGWGTDEDYGYAGEDY